MSLFMEFDSSKSKETTMEDVVEECDDFVKRCPQISNWYSAVCRCCCEIHVVSHRSFVAAALLLDRFNWCQQLLEVLTDITFILNLNYRIY